MVGNVASLILFFFCSPPTAMRVPEAAEMEAQPQGKVQVFYVFGAVAKPGEYSLTPGTELLLTEAILRAGGTTRNARVSNCVLYRRLENGTMQKLPVDIKAILEGKKPDLQIQESDVIMVPGERTRTPKSPGTRIPKSPGWIMDPPLYPPWIRRAGL